MRLLRHILYILLLVAVSAGVAAFAVYASRMAAAHRAAQPVTEVRVVMPDSLSCSGIVSPGDVVGWLDEAGIGTVGRNMEEVDLQAIREEISRHRNVRYRSAYVSYTGRLYVVVGQYRPMLRLRTDGYDAYLTADGYAFTAPEGSALFLPVVTGHYRPPFAGGYEGSVADVMDGESCRLSDMVRKARKRCLGIRYGIDTLRAQRREVMRQKIRKHLFEGEEKFRQRNAIFDEGRMVRAQRLADSIGRREALLARAADAEREALAVLKKAIARHDDFWNLLNFVSRVGTDRFLNAEIVQIEADTTYDGAIRLMLVPRSGSHRIVFGRMENVDGKIARLRKFYDGGLRNLGWETYSTIDLRCDGQVICSRLEGEDRER